MVHGTSLLVRYVLMLKRPIDKYDHLMDIMKSCCHDLKLIEKDQKIVVFDGHWMDERFNKLPGTKSVYGAVTTMKYGYDLANLESSRGSFDLCKWSHELGKTVGDVHGWFDVFFHSTRKFTVLEDIARFDEAEWLRLQNKAKEDRDDDEVLGRKYANLKDAARITHMYRDSEYLALAQQREATVTSVPLTAVEQSILDCVRGAPQLQDLIEHEGFEMYTEMF